MAKLSDMPTQLESRLLTAVRRIKDTDLHINYLFARRETEIRLERLVTSMAHQLDDAERAPSWERLVAARQGSE